MANIPYGKQHISDEDVAVVVESLRSDFLTQGPKVAKFEQAFAEYVGVKYAVAVANGTAALHLCAIALGVKEGDNVITTPITFVASANCIRYCGGNIHFADIDRETYLIDIAKVKALLESKPRGTFKGIVPVDFAGLPVNLEELRALADEYGLWIIQDSCHSPGGSFTTKKGVASSCGSGEFADLAIFSFHPVKHIACGEGGMITTNSAELYQTLLTLRTHGITRSPELLHENHGEWYYEMQELGYNYRLTDFQSALGLSQLQRADAGLARRRKIARRYDEAFSGKIVTQKTPDTSHHAYHLYVIETEKRKELYDFLRGKNIFAQVHYIPVHLQPYYRSLGHEKDDFPNAESYYERCLSLPMFPTLTDEEQRYVIDMVLKFNSECSFI
jgi:UDP-4-amino-4,6-dideoxy-N-acetyl-beta-L-altrosamine transaminase